MQMKNKDVFCGKYAADKFIHQSRFKLKAHYFHQYNGILSNNYLINPGSS